MSQVLLCFRDLPRQVTNLPANVALLISMNGTQLVELADFRIDLLGSALAVILAADHFASEENVFVVVAVLDHAKFVAHAPVTHHGAGQLGGLLDVPRGAGGNVAGDNLLGDTTGHRDGDHVEHFFAAAI